MRSKKTKLFSVVLGSLFVFSFLAVSVAFAAVPTQVTSGLDDPSKIVTLISDIGKYFQAIVLAIGVLMIIYSGFLWMTTGGEEEKLGSARKILIYGLVGIAIAVFAYAAQTFLLALLPK